VLAKPPVRKLAKDLGVDLRAVRPSGADQIVTRADVEAHARSLGTPAASPVLSAQPVSQPAAGAETRVAVRGVRKATAQAMVASAFTAPHVTEWVELDATRTMRLVRSLRDSREFAGVKLSPMLVVAKAVCLAARRTPELNASWDEAAQEIVLRRDVNLGVAVATPRGLLVPNVKGAQQLTLRELADALAALTATARDGRTQPADMTGGSFTLTNVGVFGIDAGTPILNPGESGILAMGAIRRKPWVVAGEVRPRWVTTLAVSFDHRVADGEQGSRFLADVAAIVRDPAQALLY
jgi:pyruvate dehydrogenase E2 component (dihydrolipoamide acetyltransferase)